MVPPLSFRPIPNLRINVVARHERTVVEGAAGAGGQQWYRINGAQDPDQSGTGPTPLGFNEYATLYTMYRVLAMRIQVVASGVTTATPALATVTLMPNPRQVTAPADPATWGAEYLAVSKPIVLGTTGGNNTVTLDKTYYPWEVLRIPKSTYMADMDYASLVTTLPVKQQYLMLGINSVGSAVAGTLSTTVVISYLVEFFEPNVLV